MRSRNAGKRQSAVCSDCCLFSFMLLLLLLPLSLPLLQYSNAHSSSLLPIAGESRGHTLCSWVAASIPTLESRRQLYQDTPQTTEDFLHISTNFASCPPR